MVFPVSLLSSRVAALLPCPPGPASRRGRRPSRVRARVSARVRRLVSRCLAAWLVLWCLAGVQGLASTHRIGPYSVPDPDLHSATMYALATGQALNPAPYAADGHGNMVRRQRLTGDAAYLTGQLEYNRVVTLILEHPLRPDPTLASQHHRLDRPQGTIHARAKSTQYTPLAYLPQAIGLRAAWTLGVDGPYRALQCARLANLACYLALMTLAIGLAPRGRLLLAILAGLPANAFLASSIATDATLMALTALIVALTLKAARDGKPASRAWLAGMCLAAACLILAKPPYAACLLLPLALPRRVLGHGRRTPLLAACVLATLAYLAWSHAWGGGFYDANLRDNLHTAREHPLGLVWLTIRNLLLLPATTGSPTWPSITGITLTLAAWTAALARNRRTRTATPTRTTGPHRYTTAALAAALATLTATILYLALTFNDLPAALHTGHILGIQGRYLTPLLPLLLTTTTTTRHPIKPNTQPTRHDRQTDKKGKLPPDHLREKPPKPSA